MKAMEFYAIFDDGYMLNVSPLVWVLGFIWLLTLLGAVRIRTIARGN